MNQNSVIFGGIALGWVIFATNRGDMAKIITLLRGGGKVDPTKGEKPAASTAGSSPNSAAWQSAAQKLGGNNVTGVYNGNTSAPLQYTETVKYGNDPYSGTAQPGEDITNSGIGSTGYVDSGIGSDVGGYGGY